MSGLMLTGYMTMFVSALPGAAFIALVRHAALLAVAHTLTHPLSHSFNPYPDINLTFYHHLNITINLYGWFL